MAKTAPVAPGKTVFVKEFLRSNPQGNTQAVNEAWQAAGHEGTISSALVNKTRALLGLAGNLRPKDKKQSSAKKRSKPKAAPKPANGRTAGPFANRSTRGQVVADVETEIDRLIFKLMEIGDLGQVEDSLRRARRLLYVTIARR